jgi:predicted dehydrogenase/threonine dehydrogenase-like Zn-dependent dehydrogenase
MRQVFLEKGKAVLHNVAMPLLDPYSVVIHVEYSFISTGTEYATLKNSDTPLYKKALKNIMQSVEKVRASLQEHGVQGTLILIKSLAHQSCPIGYSCSGRVVAIGSRVCSLRVGDFVAAGGSGYAHHAELVVVPEHLVARLKHAEALKEASVTTIGSIALQGLRRANLSLGEKICVVGLGLLGQLTVQLAKLSGLYVVGLDIDDERCALAKELGADSVLNVQKEQVVTTTTFATEHYGFDATIITAASSDARLIQQSIEMTRKKGKVVLVGDVKISMEREPLYQKELDFLISCSYGPGRYDTAYEQQGLDYPYAYVRWTEQRNMQCILDLIDQKKLLINPLISQEYSIDQIEQAYDSLESKKALGLVLSYKNNESNVAYDKDIMPAISSTKKTYQYPEHHLKLAVIGVGGFTKTKLIPLLKNIPAVQITSVIDTNITAAINIARQLGNITYHNDYETICNNEAINAALIATPHALHASQTIALLKSGKAVFAEKPAVVNYEQLQQLQQIIASKSIMYSVDFNRSFAPFIQKIYGVTRNRSMPLMISYRMNAGYLPQDHWIQSLTHGGRIIGEACHVIDLFLYLVGARPITINVTTLGARADLNHSDNIAIQFSFEDGSTAQLLYVATGNTTLAKERLEIFFEGKSIVMDDYTSLQGYGLHPSFNEKQCNADKGHETLLQSFVLHALSPQVPPPIPHERILMTSLLALLINELAQQGGGSLRLTENDFNLVKTESPSHQFSYL